MDNWYTVVVAIVTVIGSSGLWSTLYKRSKRDASAQNLLIGLAHHQIVKECMYHIRKGSICRTEYESLNNYLYLPYLAMGGNGLAKMFMEELKEMIVNRPFDANDSDCK